MEIAAETKKQELSLSHIRTINLIQQINSRQDFIRRIRILRYYELQQEVFVQGLLARVVALSNNILSQAREHKGAALHSVTDCGDWTIGLSIRAGAQAREVGKSFTESRLFLALLVILTAYLTLTNYRPMTMRTKPMKSASPESLSVQFLLETETYDN